jgi:hypothetical protein
MIRFTKFFWAYVISVMGMVLLIYSDEYPILFGFVGGWFCGVGLKLAREYGEQNRS